MLTACAGSVPAEGAVARPDPIVEVRHAVEVRCPAELDNPPADRPEPGAGAVIEFNDAGRDHLAALIGWGEGLFQVIGDARSACPQSVPAPSTVAP